MYIGKLSQLTGASRAAIRLYEEIGLIPTPDRRGKYRVYQTKDVAIIKLIKKAQEVGFTLDELRELVTQKSQSNHFPVSLAVSLISQKRKDIRKQIDTLSSMDKKLIELEKELQETFDN